LRPAWCITLGKLLGDQDQKKKENDLSEWLKEGLRKEFVDFARAARARSGDTLQPPTPEALSLMAQIIRENALPTEQLG
jgi:hypothetical protein